MMFLCLIVAVSLIGVSPGTMPGVSAGTSLSAGKSELPKQVRGAFWDAVSTVVTVTSIVGILRSQGGSIEAKPSVEKEQRLFNIIQGSIDENLEKQLQKQQQLTNVVEEQRRAIGDTPRKSCNYRMPENIREGYLDVALMLAETVVKPEKRRKCVNVREEVENRFLVSVARTVAATVIPGETIDICGNESPLDAPKTPRKLTHQPPKLTRGVARIHYYREGPLCSAVHLRPWILLTMANCVYGRQLRRIFATVTYRKETGVMYHTRVQVHSIRINPNYKNGSRVNNEAVVLIHSQIDWDVDEFTLPLKNLNTDRLLAMKTVTYVNQWVKAEDDRSRAFSVKASATNNYEKCGYLGNLGDGWYCVDRNGVNHVYNQMDIASPFYYEAGKKKFCLGLYTGERLSESMKGHLFQSTFPNVYWIEAQVHEHPVPPS